MFKCDKAPPLFLMFRPSPCPNHYDGRLATRQLLHALLYLLHPCSRMPSADFCLITHRVASVRAIGLHLIRSPRSIHSLEPRHLLTRASLVDYRSLVKQISPDKSMYCHCTAASFTVAVRSHGFVVLCQLAFSLRLI